MASDGTGCHQRAGLEFLLVHAVVKLKLEQLLSLSRSPDGGMISFDAHFFGLKRAIICDNCKQVMELFVVLIAGLIGRLEE